MYKPSKELSELIHKLSGMIDDEDTLNELLSLVTSYGAERYTSGLSKGMEAMLEASKMSK